MSGEIRFPVVGNLTADPTLNYTASGTPVVNFTIASTAREFDRKTGQMGEGDTTFIRCTAWRELAENLSQSLRKGTRVLAFGRLRQRKYRPDGGAEERTTWELEVEAIGPDLRWATAEVTKRPASNAGPASPWGQTPPAEPWEPGEGPF